MIDPSTPFSVPQSAPAVGARAAASLPANSQAVDASALVRGARFQALLEELDLRAKAMAKSAQEPLSAESLPAAVENARSSMQDAPELSRSLLEAFRQSTAQTPDSNR